MDWSFFQNTEKQFNKYIEDIKNLELEFQPFPLGEETVHFDLKLNELYEKHKDAIINDFENDLNTLEESGVLTTKWGSFEKFKDQYYFFQGIFFTKYPDAEEIDYLKKEYEILKDSIPFESFVKETHSYQKLMFSNKKKIAFLEDKANQLGYQLIYNDKTEKLVVTKFENKLRSEEKVKDWSKSNNLKWYGTDLELFELIKSLIESKKIVGGNQKQIFKTLFNQFGVDYSDERKRDAIATIRQRVKDKTPFIEELQLSLESWIKAKDEDTLNQ
ncbi:MAG: RteC domain-containing protein [Allomuricauda sp.]